MFPVYGFMDSSDPHLRHQNGCHKTVPAYIPSRPPMVYESWPYGCNYSFPAPMPFTPSYSHGGVSGHHGFRPSFPAMMPSPVPYFAPYGMPYYPEPYPVYYAPEMPPYGSENDGAWSRKHHCCGCPNHQKEDTSKKIQEEGQKLNDWNGWIPLDMDKINHLMNGEGEKRARDQKSERRNMEESERTKDGEDQTRPSPFPIIWMNPHYRRADELEDKEGKEVKTSQKCHLGGGKSFENPEPCVEKDIAVNWIDPHKEEKKSEADEENNKTSDSSSPKVPKLPPVCLRVDPLPKKYTKGFSPKKSSKEGSSPKKSPNTEISPCIPSESSENHIVEKAGDSTRKPEKEKLSDLEAALRIQSAFRGYEIRRSRPLEKLKQIAEVRKQMLDVHDGIRALESACGLGEVDKKKLVLAETIMRLLLKLDTVQGLHQSLRDVRKSLAKELVTLQEKLDSLVINEKPKAELCASESVDEAGTEGKRNGSELEQQQESPDKRSSDAGTASNVIEEDETNEGKLEKQQESPDERSSDADTASNVSEGERDGSKVEIQQESLDEQSSAADTASNVSEEGEKNGSKLEKQQESPDEQRSDADTASNVCDEGERDGSKLEIQQESPDERSADADTASNVIEEGKRNGSKLEIQQESLDDRSSDADTVSDAIEFGQDRILSVNGVIKTFNGDGDVMVSEGDVVDDQAGRDPKTENPNAEANMEERDEPEDVCVTNEEVEEAPMEEVQQDVLHVANMPQEIGESDITEFPEEVIKAETEENIKQIKEDGGREVKSVTVSESMEMREEEHDLFDEEDLNQNPSDIKKPEEPLQEIQTGKAKEDEERCIEEITVKSEDILESMPAKADMSTGKSGTAVEENEKLRETMEKLIEAGQQQLNVIFTLSDRVKNLEKKLSKRKSKHGRRSVLCKKRSADLAM